MRLPACVLAITLFGVVACGTATPRVEPATEPKLEGPFVDRKGFKPTSFVVDVTGDGRPIIFIPGLGSPGEVWDETVEHLDGKYASHVLTLAGFAGRPPIKEPLSATVRRELTRYIQSNRLKRPIIVGHSMGGFIALWLAANFPENVGPVIVVDAGPALSGDLDEAKLLRERWAKATDEEFALQAQYMYTGMITNPKRLEAIATAAAKSNRRALGDAIYEMMTTDLTDRMGEIESPCLFVLADGMYQQRIKTQVEAISDKEIVVVPKARHFVMIDNPDAFFTALDAFLAAHPPKT